MCMHECTYVHISICLQCMRCSGGPNIIATTCARIQNMCPRENPPDVLFLLSKVNLNKTKKAVSFLNNSWLALIAHFKNIHNFPQFSDTLITQL